MNEALSDFLEWIMRTDPDPRFVDIPEEHHNAFWVALDAGLIASHGLLEPGYYLSLKGRAALAEMRIESQPPKGNDPWADYRNSPGGPLLTTPECKERFGVSGKDLSTNDEAKATRRDNPDGRGFVYRYDVVARIAKRKSGDD